MGSAGSILVVENEAEARETLAGILGTRYEVRAMSTGTAALESLCTASFDLVLLDDWLPDLPSNAILQVITRFFPATKVVIIAEVGTEKVKCQPLRRGVSGYLRKPVDPRDLHARVAALLASPQAGPGWHQPPADHPVVPRDSSDRGGVIRKALRYMETRLDTDLSLSAVARAAGLSKYHFCRRFKASTGMSFREYLAQRRIARAKELLQAPGRTITTITREVGFKDVTHFGRVFKRVVGQRPSEFRQRALGERSWEPAGSEEQLPLS